MAAEPMLERIKPQFFAGTSVTSRSVTGRRRSILASCSGRVHSVHLESSTRTIFAGMQAKQMRTATESGRDPGTKVLYSQSPCNCSPLLASQALGHE